MYYTNVLKNRIYHFFHDIINIKNFDPNNINPVYIIFNKVSRYFKEINGNKYLTIVPTNE